MSVNRILKKRKQQTQNSHDSIATEGTDAPQFASDHPKMTQQETKLEQQFQKYAEYTQYNPSAYQYSNSHLPYCNSLNNRFKLPISIALPPVSYDMDPVQHSIDKIPRCGSCRAYMNYYNQVKKNSFLCFLCGRENSFMGNYEMNPESIELTQPSYHVLGGQNVYLQMPPENALIFMVDVSSSSAQSKMLYYFVAAAKQILSREDFNETQVYFFTYDEVVHEYDFSGQEVKCTVFDPSISNSGGRVQQNFLQNIRQKLFILLDSLQQISQNNKKQGSNFYQSFAYIFQAIKHTGGKMFILQSNEAIVGQNFANQYIKNPNNNQVQAKPRSFLQSRNKLFFNTYVQQLLTCNISMSLFVFQKNFKNLRVFADLAKLTNSELLLYKKDTPEDLMKFYYDFTYLLGCTYYSDVRMEVIASPGWVITAVYGNLYRIKEYISFKFCHLESSKRTFVTVQPLQTNELPYFCMQVITNYLYNRQHFVTVNTVVLPLTTSLEKLYSNQDYNFSSAVLQRTAFSSLRLQEINNLRNKFTKNLAHIWKCANDFYKKVIHSLSKKVTPEINNFMLTQLALLKSNHFQLEAVNDSHTLDVIVSQRNILQSSGIVDIQNFFSPYLFNLSSMTQQMCQEEENFVYPEVCELKFSSVKEGMYLLDNGLSLYLYISKVCDPTLLKMLFGKDKFTKTDHLSEDSFLTGNVFSEQVGNLVRVLREQKCYGWIPLYVVRCGEGNFNEKTFYMNFYAEKYDEFRGCKLSLSEFTATLSTQY